MPDPEIPLLGHSETLGKLDCIVSTSFIYEMVFVKRCFLKMWKSKSPLQFEMWLNELIGVLHVDKL